MLTMLRQPWVLRRIGYLVVFIAAFVAGVVGWVSPDEAAGWIAQAGPWITVIVSAVAASKANPGSDTRPPSVGEVVDAVRDAVTTATPPVPSAAGPLGGVASARRALERELGA